MDTSATIGIADAIREWDVSERTLRRRLSQNLIEGARRDDHGHWLIPVSWLSDEFARLDGSTDPADDASLVIDLRDETVAVGLAEALSQLTKWSDRVVDAEVRIATTEHELETTENLLRRATNDLEAQITERTKLEQDLSETTTTLRFEVDRRERAEQRADQAEAALKQLEIERKACERDMRAELDKQRTSLTTLKAISSRRGRRKLQRLLDEAEGV